MNTRRVPAIPLVLLLAALSVQPVLAQGRFQAILDARLSAAIHEVEAGLDGVLGLAL